MTAGSAARSRRSPWTLVAILGTTAILLGTIGLHLTVLVVGSIIQVVFFAYFLRHLAFAMSAMHAARRALDSPDVDSGHRPNVSVVVACKNEESVAARLVESLMAIDYPTGLLQLIIVDDGSDDQTGEVLDALVALYRARPEPAHHLDVIHRAPGAGGGKSGALNAALEIVTGTVTVVFDADHVPSPDCVWRLARHFQDPSVGAVQGRCEIVNPDDSPLARLVANDYLAGYLVNEFGRQSLYQLPAYGGANCAVRTSCVRQVGGWNTESVTEDTDLTMRLLLSGLRVRYDITAVDFEEGVVSLDRYWKQRYRWSRGHQQVCRDYRRAVLSCRYLRPIEKVEALMFLLSFHVPALAGLGLIFMALWLAGAAGPVDVAFVFFYWTVLFLGPVVELAAGLLISRADRREVSGLAWSIPLFFIGVAVCSKSWLDGVLGRPYSWVKTKRSGDSDDPRPARPLVATG